MLANSLEVLYVYGFSLPKNCRGEKVGHPKTTTSAMTNRICLLSSPAPLSKLSAERVAISLLSFDRDIGRALRIVAPKGGGLIRVVSKIASRRFRGSHGSRGFLEILEIIVLKKGAAFKILSRGSCGFRGSRSTICTSWITLHHFTLREPLSVTITPPITPNIFWGFNKRTSQEKLHLVLSLLERRTRLITPNYSQRSNWRDEFHPCYTRKFSGN